jgi:hypothetical protein
VVVNDFYVFGAFRRPDKANAPLIVDPNAVLALSIPFQGFKLIPGRDAQIFQDRRPIELFKLAQRWALHIDPSAYTPALKQGFGLLALEALYRHGRIITPSMNNVKRV